MLQDCVRSHIGEGEEAEVPEEAEVWAGEVVWLCKSNI